MTVFGRTRDFTGTPRTGPIFFIPRSAPAVDGDDLIVADNVSTNADEDGNFELTLSPGSYEVHIPGTRPFYVNVDATLDPRNLNTLVDAGATFLNFPPGGQVTPATEDFSGTVKTERTSASPIVPLAEDVNNRIEPLEEFSEEAGEQIETLENTTSGHAERIHTVEAVSSQNAAGVSELRTGELNPGSLSSDKLKTTTDADKVGFAHLREEVLESFGTALDPSLFQGSWDPTTDTPTIDDPSGQSTGFWYVVDTAGVATGTNADGTYTYGDLVISNGDVWLRKLVVPPPLADESVTRPKLSASLAAELPKFIADLAPLWAVQDPTGKLGIWLNKLGKICGVLNIASDVANGLSVTWDKLTGKTLIRLGTVEGVVPLGDHSVTVAEDNEVYAIAVVDQDLKFAAGIRHDGTFVVARFEAQELSDARGGEDSLDDRLSKFLGPHGQPARGYHNQWTLRDWRRLKFDMDLGTAGIKPSIMFIGDSWVAITTNFVTFLTRRLKAIYGTSGEGYNSFGVATGGGVQVGPSDSANGTVVRTGAWSNPTAFDGRGPELIETTSSVLGNKITTTLAVNADSALIYYLKKSGGGGFRYRFNAGSWTSVSTANGSDALGIETVTTIPSAPITMEIEVETAGMNGVTLFGVEWKRTTDGVRLHRVGHAGSKSTHWANAPALWEASVTQLNPDITFIVLGTNDQGTPVTEDDFVTNIETIVGRLRAVRAGMDIVLVAPCENLSGRSTPMTTYRDALMRVAMEQRCAVVDLIRHFGDSATEYNQSSPRVLMDSTISTVHLVDNGNKLASEAMLRLLLEN
jgi:lysophospholipase L1-like esterase